jgi:mRNA interferase MazF
VVRAAGRPPASKPPLFARGTLWWAELEPAAGSAPGFRRPVLIVQADAFNRSALQTTIAVVLTSNLRLADAPGNVRLTARETGLPKDSVANVSQVLTLDRDVLTVYVGALADRLVRRVEDGLRLVLGL